MTKYVKTYTKCHFALKSFFNKVMSDASQVRCSVECPRCQICKLSIAYLSQKFKFAKLYFLILLRFLSLNVCNVE